MSYILVSGRDVDDIQGWWICTRALDADGGMEGFHFYTDAQYPLAVEKCADMNALAGIAATREPTEAMCEAACMNGRDRLVAVHLADVKPVWRAMIDAALTDG